MTLRQAAFTLGHSFPTVVDWFNLCREVCTKKIENEPQLIGTVNEPVQIDEAYFSGRRKYNRWRLLAGNRVNTTANDEKEGEEVVVYDEVAPVEEQREEQGNNYVDMKDWKWVLGIYASSSKARFVRARPNSSFTNSYHSKTCIP
eukprot:IDg2679t1